MSKQRKRNQQKSVPKPLEERTETGAIRRRRLPLLSPYAVMFILVWMWAGFWYGDVFRIAREYSFWAPDGTLMYYKQGLPWGELWQIGLMLLQLYRWPAVGALLTSLFVTGGAYLLAYCLRLRGWWRLLQYIPVGFYLGITAYVGFNLYYETETGMIMGIPFLCFLVLLIMATIIRSFSRHGMPPLFLAPKDEGRGQYTVQLVSVVVLVLIAVGITHWMRPYVRVVTRMQTLMMEQEWGKMAQTARDHAELSYRPIAAYYAIALVQRGEIGSRMFDIRLDYDDLYIRCFDGTSNSAANYYTLDCDFYAGLVMTSIHHSVENMTMNGPSIRTLKMLAKCALLTGEWEVAEKYFAIIRKVPFEGKWLGKYEPMLRDTTAINNDPEFKMVRLTEPIHDNFENNLVQPVFLGYNAALMEGRSVNALWNSLAVHIYTKSMPQFILRCQPLQGTLMPESFAEALALMSSKQPEIIQQFPGTEFRRNRLANFASDVKPYMGDRPKYARELFDKYKGYYPYYYFFGNLKATKKKTNEGSSNSGVN